MDKRLLCGLVIIIALVVFGFYMQANRVNLSSGIGFESSETCLGEGCDETDCHDIYKKIDNAWYSVRNSCNLFMKDACSSFNNCQEIKDNCQDLLPPESKGQCEGGDGYGGEDLNSCVEGLGLKCEYSWDKENQVCKNKVWCWTCTGGCPNERTNGWDCENLEEHACKAQDSCVNARKRFDELKDKYKGLNCENEGWPAFPNNPPGYDTPLCFDEGEYQEHCVGVE